MCGLLLKNSVQYIIDLCSGQIDLELKMVGEIQKNKCKEFFLAILNDHIGGSNSSTVILRLFHILLNF